MVVMIIVMMVAGAYQGIEKYITGTEETRKGQAHLHVKMGK